MLMKIFLTILVLSLPGAITAEARAGKGEITGLWSNLSALGILIGGTGAIICAIWYGPTL